jgi:putative ATPase
LTSRSLFESPDSMPLAARMRPRTLDEFVGQEDIVGPGRALRRAI